MNYLLLGRIAKAVALFGFFLPWVTVSCSNTPMFEATGWQLMTGDIQSSNGSGQMQFSEEPEPAVLVIVAFAVVAIGLIAAVLTKGRAAAMALVIGAVAGMGVSYFSVQNLRGELNNQMDEAQQQGGGQTGGFLSANDQREMGQAVANAIEVEEEEGFWLTVIALLATAVLGALVLAERRATGPPA